MHIDLYTDGSCLGNPGPGGWAYLLRIGSEVLREAGGEPWTTNNRMEMQAVIEGLAFVREKYPDASKICVHTDSALIVNTMTKNWKRKKNVDLWEQILPLLLGCEVKWQWVKGHAGHPENEDCDSRALAEAKEQEKITRQMDPSDLRLPGENPAFF